MSIKEKLSNFWGFFQVGAFIIIGLLIISFFIDGMAWASAKLLPWFSVLTWFSFVIVVFILLPLAIPKKTREASSVALFIASYVFGATLWMVGLLLTMAIWGGTAVFIGLFLMGIGVVPIAMLATLINGIWWPFIELILLTIMTFGCRIGALSLENSLES